MDYRLLRGICQIIKEFERDIEQNGGKRTLEGFIEWLKEKVWEDFEN